MPDRTVLRAASTNYVCPVCGKQMLSASMLCSGGFLDTDHPSNVVPVVGSPPVTPALNEERER